MSQLLASDLNNPEFANPVNPDSRLHVRFYKRAVKNNFRSEQEGAPKFDEIDYVEITTPGDVLNTLDVPVREDHKKRFPMHWAHFMNTNGAESGFNGTPVDHWPRITRAQAEELKALKFPTVESIANASDQNLQRLGMVGGMSPFAFRDAAMRFLQVSKDDAAVNAAAETARAAEARANELQEGLANAMRQIAALREELQEKKADVNRAEFFEERKKPGPKAKEAA